MKLLNFGSCNIDYVYRVDHAVLPGETIAAQEMQIFPGGKGLNQSIAAARAGAQVYHAGCIGNDGVILERVLQDNGVDVSFLKKEDSQSGHAIIQVEPKGENCILVYPGTNAGISQTYMNEVFEHFSCEDMLLLQNEINNVTYLIEQANAKHMTVVFNPSPFQEELKAIDLNRISYLILNEIEAKALTDIGEPLAFLAYMQKTYPNLKTVLTLGKQGCIYADRTQVLMQPAFRVEAVDTTAAGDTFTGYFVSLLAGKKSCADALYYASLASAIAVSRPGAAPSIPTLQEVEASAGRLQHNL